MSENEIHENIQEIEPTVFNDEIIHDLPTESEIQIPIMNEVIDNINLTSSSKKELIECNATEKESKMFVCYICNKKYNMYFLLKQNIKKVHEKKKSYNTLSKVLCIIKKWIKILAKKVIKQLLKQII